MKRKMYKKIYYYTSTGTQYVMPQHRRYYIRLRTHAVVWRDRVEMSFLISRRNRPFVTRARFKFLVTDLIAKMLYTLLCQICGDSAILHTAGVVPKPIQLKHIRPDIITFVYRPNNLCRFYNMFRLDGLPLTSIEVLIINIHTVKLI